LPPDKEDRYLKRQAMVLIDSKDIIDLLILDRKELEKAIEDRLLYKWGNDNLKIGILSVIRLSK
jgi:hypothetical protein